MCVFKRRMARLWITCRDTYVYMYVLHMVIECDTYVIHTFVYMCYTTAPCGAVNPYVLAALAPQEKEHKANTTYTAAL